MKISRVVISALLIILLIIIYSVSMTFIKKEDFIGTYYSVNIKSDINMEICGTSTGIIDNKEDEGIINYIDSMIVVGDTIYGISRNKYFLLNLSNRKVTYSSTPLSQYSTYNLLSPMEYYEKKTRHIDIIGGIVLVGFIILIITFTFPRKHKVRYGK